jgi:predicted component of viral defense system (DUF524 family)
VNAGAHEVLVGSRPAPQQPPGSGNYLIRFENQLGLARIRALDHGGREIDTHHVEVIATKFQSAEDSLAFLKATLADLFSRSSAMPFLTSAMTEQMVRESTAPPNLIFAFHFLRHHHREFIEAVQAILGCPHQRLSEIEEQVRPHEVRHIDRESLIRILHTGHPSPVPATGGVQTLSPLRRLRPERIWQRRPEETFDTPENRYVLHICRQMLETIRRIERQGWYRDYAQPGDKRHLHAVTEALTMLTVDRRFVALGPMVTIPTQSRVLQRKDGYRELGVLWQQLQRSRQPVFERMQSAIDLRNVAELYEFWVLFELVDRIRDITGVDPVATGTPGPFGEPGQGQRFRFAGFGDLYYNQGRIGYSGISLRPDYLWQPVVGEWVAFDAKFRMDKPDEQMDEETGEVSYAGESTSKHNDWQKMHTYRDGLKRVRAAVVLYPGDVRKFRGVGGESLDVNVADLLAGDINGIGAIPMQPLGTDLPPGLVGAD